MHLKSITLHGFKSFCNRTEIPLGAGITSIVGPNGCGKSNVSDSIRWVLGEGNIRNLRGESIVDVIFKGSGTAKPSGFAEVSLLVDNEDRSLPLDHAEISIARRVFRSGDSEFLINHIPCRLKDIKNLFLGTGLGSSGYSVIERQMVDEVLSDHDEQRRIYFEEAAGISRYKIQRKEALRKLEATEQDLIRIDDIVREIEREVRSLARQVGKSRKHERLLTQIRDLEVHFALRQWARLEEARTSCTSERDHWSDQRERLATDLSRREAELETRKLRLLERERLLDEVRRRREELLSEQSSNREEGSVLAARIQSWEQKEIELSRRIEEESDREAGLRVRIESTLPDLDRLISERGRHQQAVDSADGVFQEAERLLRESREISASAAQLRMDHLLIRTKDDKDLEAIIQQEEQHVLRRNFVIGYRDSLVQKAQDLSVVMTGIEEESSSVDGKLTEVKEALSELEQARLAAEADREELRQQREDLARRRASLESRLNLLREQKSRHEGFDAAIHFLLEKRSSVPGIHGVVGELVAASGAISETTAEALLSEAIQWVVVEDEETAVRTLALLRSAGQGGVTLFPLRENAGRDFGPAASWPDGSPLSGAPELAPLIRFLESRVRPEGSLEAARDAARAGGPSLRHLTPDGDVFATEGWIRAAGGRDVDRDIIERMREIPRLEESCERLSRDEASARSRLAAREEEIATRAEEIRQRGEDRSALETRRNRCERELSERRVERGLLLEESERTASELGSLDERIARLEADRSEITRRLGASESTGQEAEQRYEQAKGREEEASRRRDDAFAALSAARTEAVRIETAVRELETSRQRDGEEADRLEGAIRLWKEERTESALLRTEAHDARQALEARATEIEAALGEADQSLEQRRQERDEDSTLVAADEHAIREVRAELNGLMERLHDDQLREVEIRSEMERLRDRLMQEFRVDIAEEAANRPVPADGEAEVTESAEEVEQARRRIEELRRAQQSIGPVNFLASEEYARQKERLLFHRSQQEDLRKARKDLLETIGKINDTAGVMFRETFDAARIHFQQTFEYLFPGGEADVRLVGEDPLEAEIEIVARPSGKKLQMVRLLSTGERALTAIALLFGIYLVKPSPFCILDELDAPLDDANIGRFVTLLRHFSERTQFVVITHNKRTMEAADRLYGVTMQQAGISKIVSVRLNETGAEVGGVAAEAAPAGLIEGEEA